MAYKDSDLTKAQLRTLNGYRKAVHGDEAASQAMMKIFMNAQKKKGSDKGEDKVAIDLENVLTEAYQDKPPSLGRHGYTIKKARRGDSKFTVTKNEAPHTPPKGRDVTYEKG